MGIIWPADICRSVLPQAECKDGKDEATIGFK